MLVMGIDPGLTRCGVGVVEGTPGRARLVAVGVVRTEPDLDLSRRLLQIETGLEEWVVTHRPEAIAVERVFAQHNVTTVMGTAQAAGIAMLVAADAAAAVALAICHAWRGSGAARIAAALAAAGAAPRPRTWAAVAAGRARGEAAG